MRLSGAHRKGIADLIGLLRAQMSLGTSLPLKWTAAPPLENVPICVYVVYPSSSVMSLARPKKTESSKFTIAYHYRMCTIEREGLSAVALAKTAASAP